MAGTKKASAKAKKDFGAVFVRLKQILQRHADSLSVKTDKPGNYYLESSALMYKGRPVFFGAVQIKKNYVSFHLMPLYAFPALGKGMSPELKKRMQGKSCFNFTTSDETLFAELGRLTATGFERFRQERSL